METFLFTILVRAVTAGTPLLLGTLGEILAERSGVMNLGVEGMMAMGAVTGYLGAYGTGSPWLGLAAGLAAGALMALLHAAASVSLKVNQVVSGLALTMLGMGLSGLLGRPFIGRPLIHRLEALPIPLLGEIPVLGRILFRHDPFFYLAVVLGLALWFFLRHTRWGIEVRSAGENPAAVDAQGISVSRIRYLATIAGGALAGMAGANLSLSYSSSWIEGMTGGRGWIVIALTIFSLWNPLRAFLGAFLFGGVFVLQYLLQPLGIPPNLLAMLPYLTTLAVLVAGRLARDPRRFKEPAALGEPYSRGEG